MPHLLLIVVLPLAICVLRIKVILLRWHERRLGLFAEQLLPFIVLEPNVILDLLWAIKAKSVDWLSLDKLIDEVSCLETPARGNFISSDLHLLG